MDDKTKITQKWWPASAIGPAIEVFVITTDGKECHEACLMQLNKKLLWIKPDGSVFENVTYWTYMPLPPEYYDE